MPRGGKRPKPSAGTKFTRTFTSLLRIGDAGMRSIVVKIGGGTPDSPNPPSNPTVGSLPVGEAVYPVPGGAIYVATTGNDTTGDGTVNTPYATLQKAITEAVAWDTIVFREGEYHQGAAAYSFININKVGLTIQNYPSEAVWFDGSSVVTGWVVHAAGVWKKTGWSFTPPYDYNYSQNSTSNSAGFVNADHPCAHMPDQVFIDGSPLAQVATLAEVTAGRFYIDRAADVAYIGSDPTNKEVRLSDLSVCCIALESDITIRGVGFRRYANPIPDQGPVRLHRARGLLENVVSEWNATTGIGLMGGADCVVRNCTSRYNGLMGLGAYQADGALVEASEFSYNNQEWFNAAPSAGGLKMTRTQVATFKNNLFASNIRSTGLWLDEVVYNFIITGNDCINNAASGMNLEISELGVVADNRITGNAGTQLLVQGTNHLTFWCNTIAGNEFECVVFQQDNRDPLVQTGVRDNRQPTSFYEDVCTWWMDSMTWKNNVIGESRYAPWRIKQYNYTGGDYTPLPSKGWAAFGIDSDGNLFNRTYRISTTSPGTLVGAWSTGVPGTELGSSSLASWKTNSTSWGRSADPSSAEISGTGVLDVNYMLTSQTQASTSGVGRPLPADVAALIGRSAGDTHLGAWRASAAPVPSLTLYPDPALYPGDD